MTTHPLISFDKPWLAPLAGYSDLPFRLLCRELGAACAVTEMVSAKGLVYSSHGTKDLLATVAEDAPLVVQLFGCEPEMFARAMDALLEAGFVWFDLNCGCSVPKVVKAGCGAALMRSPDVLRRMHRGHTDPTAMEGFLADLRGVWPRFGLGLDLLAGFPGETEADFRATLEGLRRWPVSSAHVFPFSPRPGTAAATFPGRLPRAEAARRAALLRQEAESRAMGFARSLLALPRLQVALEHGRPGHGVCEHYADCRLVREPAAGPRALVDVRPLAAEGRVLLVEEC